MARPAGQLERSLAALTLGMAQSQERRRTRLADTATGEYEQQVRVPLAGTASKLWGYVDKRVAWELPYVSAPLQRRVAFDTPHFTHGIEFTAPTADLVIVTAHVVSWNLTEENWYVGATVRFAVQCPNRDNISYQAVAHLSFQGWGGSYEGGEYQ